MSTIKNTTTTQKSTNQTTAIKTNQTRLTNATNDNVDSQVLPSYQPLQSTCYGESTTKVKNST